MSLGPAEILVIFVVALLVFGPTRLPEVGRQVGRGMRELKKFQQTLKGDLDDVLKDDSSSSSASTSAPITPVPAQTEPAPTEPAPTLPPKELTETDPAVPAISDIVPDAPSAPTTDTTSEVNPAAAAESTVRSEPPPTSAPA